MAEARYDPGYVAILAFAGPRRKSVETPRVDMAAIVQDETPVLAGATRVQDDDDLQKKITTLSSLPLATNPNPAGGPSFCLVAPPSERH